jgi:hypothetical protein
MDVGCANGALLRAFHSLYPCWSLNAYDISDRYQKEIEGLPGVEAFHFGPLSEVRAGFDLITLLHTLEHVPEPIILLQQLRTKLTEQGILLVQVPNLMENPFDLVVFDHASHFAVETLTSLAGRVGFEVMTLSTDWVAKEITLVLRASSICKSDRPALDSACRLSSVAYDNLAWLEELIDEARAASSGSKFGAFGTAIAGTWLANTLGEVVEFFLDEDPHQAGGVHLGRPVFRPADAPEGSCIYLALPPLIAERVYHRIQPIYPALNFITPPGPKHSALDWAPGHLN